MPTDISVAFGQQIKDNPETLPAHLKDSSVRTCLILSGHNDAFAGARPETMLRDMADCALICRLKGVEPVVPGPILVRSVPGKDRSAQERILKAWNHALAAFCKENEISFMDLQSFIDPSLLDPATGNHLSDAGMERLADLVADGL